MVTNECLWTYSDYLVRTQKYPELLQQAERTVPGIMLPRTSTAWLFSFYTKCFLFFLCHATVSSFPGQVWKLPTWLCSYLMPGGAWSGLAL